MMCHRHRRRFWKACGQFAWIFKVCADCTSLWLWLFQCSSVLLWAKLSRPLEEEEFYLLVISTQLCCFILCVIALDTDDFVVRDSVAGWCNWWRVGSVYLLVCFWGSVPLWVRILVKTSNSRATIFKILTHMGRRKVYRGKTCPKLNLAWLHGCKVFLHLPSPYFIIQPRAIAVNKMTKPADKLYGLTLLSRPKLEGQSTKSISHHWSPCPICSTGSNNLSGSKFQAPPHTTSRVHYQDKCSNECTCSSVFICNRSNFLDNIL